MNILIIGATGSLGRVVRQYFLDHSQDQLTLMARSIDQIETEREHSIRGSVLNCKILCSALDQLDVVFACLSGNLTQMAQGLVTEMEKSKVKRLIFVSSMGIYNEIPASVGERGNLKYNPILQDYRNSADIVENSGLDYTIIRPGWFDNRTDLDYELTKKGEPFGGHDVSRISIADLVLRLVHEPNFGVRESFGINRRSINE